MSGRLRQDLDGPVIELGNWQLVFTTHQCGVIAMRADGCIIPGRHVPAPWREIHHVIEHADGGPTNTDNGVNR